MTPDMTFNKLAYPVRLTLFPKEKYPMTRRKMDDNWNAYIYFRIQLPLLEMFFVLKTIMVRIWKWQTNKLGFYKNDNIYSEQRNE